MQCLNFNTMKKLIVIILLLPIMASSQNNVYYNSIGFEYTPFINNVCKYLGIKDHEIYIEWNKMPKHLHGVSYKTPQGMYVIYINIDSDRRKEALVHELVHIKQDIDGRWDLRIPTTLMTRQGHKYINGSENIEKEARLLSREIIKKIK